ncbi:hypothetical protein I2F27_12565 [Acinetobacter sp. B5B]|uniref:hypothetical protein n=1 Tax=Acinetobacter baretiae TaxID=2605383 RepID=UPI0018C34BB8|nr:hypothetical protein [Acinetobacter baretiae]MBF7684122.1 hypothetical protein [Acinetobacter baretiae]
MSKSKTSPQDLLFPIDLKKTSVNFNKKSINNIEDSVRPIYTIITDCTLDENKQFKDIYFGNSGSCILLKEESTFFILTAYHVLKNFLELETANTSPFRIPLSFKKNFNKLNDFLYPRFFWKISEITNNYESKYDFSDVILVELFKPNPDQEVDGFIDINEVKSLAVSEFKDNLRVKDLGFSILSNEVRYEQNKIAPFDEKLFSCSTLIKRDELMGRLREENSFFYFEKDRLFDSNGMSGGLIVTTEDHPRAIGMHIRGSQTSKITNFLPIKELFDAIRNRQTTTKLVIDYCAQERQEKAEKFLNKLETWAIETHQKTEFLECIKFLKVGLLYK